MSSEERTVFKVQFENYTELFKTETINENKQFEGCGLLRVKHVDWINKKQEKEKEANFLAYSLSNCLEIVETNYTNENFTCFTREWAEQCFSEHLELTVFQKKLVDKFQSSRAKNGGRPVDFSTEINTEWTPCGFKAYLLDIQ